MDLSRQELIGLLESMAACQFSSTLRRHKLAYRLSDRFKLWNTHILNSMIGNGIECRLIGSRGIDRVKRNLSEGSSLLIVGVLINRSACTRWHIGPAEGLARQGQILRTGGPGDELEVRILVAAGIDETKAPSPQPTAATEGHCSRRIRVPTIPP